MPLFLGDQIQDGYQDISGKANVGLDNLLSTGKNIANWSSNVSNCITHIPQDIKLELNNGTLTLKAGSKVYVPNGFDGADPKFDVVNITSDVSTYFAGADRGLCLAFYQPDANALGWYRLSDCGSGTTQSGNVFYNTSTNTIKFVSENQRASLPLGIIYETNGSGISSIDQIFNGFGYIGSTVFALPGVKGLIPDGRNADGSLKSIPFESTQVATVAGAGKYEGFIAVTSNFLDLTAGGYYDSQLNACRLSDRTFYRRCFAGLFSSDSNGKITRFKINNVFHALDYNDTSYISRQAMPSAKFTNLSLGASCSTYMAPANGWVYVNKNGDPNQFFNLINVTKDYAVNGITSASPFGLLMILPVSKGDTFRTDYNLNGVTNYFRFIYAQGEV